MKKFLILYAILISVSTIFSFDRSTSFFGLVDHHEGMLTLFSYIAICYLAMIEKKPKRLINTIISVSVVVSIIAIAQYIGYDIFRYDFGKWLIMPKKTFIFKDQLRFPQQFPYATMYQSNFLGVYCALVLPLAYFFKKYWSSFIIFVALYVSHSSSARLAIFMCVGIYFALKFKKKWLLVPLFIGFVAAPIIHLKFIAESHEWGYFASNRGQIWIKSMPIVGENLIVGAGPDMFVATFYQNDSEANKKYFSTARTLVDKPHSFYLQMAIHTGLLSLIAFLVMISKFLKRQMCHGIYFSIISFLLCSIYNDSTVGVSVTFWIILGLGFNWRVMHEKFI